MERFDIITQIKNKLAEIEFTEDVNAQLRSRNYYRENEIYRYHIQTSIRG